MNSKGDLELLNWLFWPPEKRLFSTLFFGDFTIFDLVISDPFDDNEFVNKGKSFEGWNEIEYTVGG